MMAQYGARLSCLPRTRGVFIATTSGHSFPSICCINGNQRRKHNIYMYVFQECIIMYNYSIQSSLACPTNPGVPTLQELQYSYKFESIQSTYTLIWYASTVFLFAFNFGYSLFGIFFFQAVFHPAISGQWDLTSALSTWHPSQVLHGFSPGIGNAKVQERTATENIPGALEEMQCVLWNESFF